METVEDDPSAACLFITEVLTMVPRMSPEKLMAAQAEAALAIASALDGVARRSFVAVPAIVADRYQVLVDAPFAEEARRVLAAAMVAPADSASRPV